MFPTGAIVVVCTGKENMISLDLDCLWVGRVGIRVVQLLNSISLPRVREGVPSYLGSHPVSLFGGTSSSTAALPTCAKKLMN